MVESGKQMSTYKRKWFESNRDLQEAREELFQMRHNYNAWQKDLEEMSLKPLRSKLRMATETNDKLFNENRTLRRSRDNAEARVLELEKELKRAKEARPTWNIDTLEVTREGYID